jgi:hypothetical protein
MQCNPTPLNLQILFGEVDRSEGQVIALWNTGVTMSWPHAKLLLLFLASQVHDHEEANAPIVICDAIRPDFLPASAAKLSLKQLGEIIIKMATPAATVPASSSSVQ